MSADVRFVHFLADYDSPKGQVQRMYGEDAGLTIQQAKQQMAGSSRIKVNVHGQWVEIDKIQED